jgi:hypothetical protein
MVWMKVPDGYCTEMSDLSANGNPPMPEANDMRFDYRKATPSRNTDNEVEFWVFTFRGKNYTVFND